MTRHMSRAKAPDPRAKILAEPLLPGRPKLSCVFNYSSPPAGVLKKLLTGPLLPVFGSPKPVRKMI
jgi:hypothetical protein